MAIQTIQVERTTETPSQNPNVNPLTLMDMVQDTAPESRAKRVNHARRNERLYFV